jgi:hypothetical protein
VIAIASFQLPSLDRSEIGFATIIRRIERQQPAGTKPASIRLLPFASANGEKSKFPSASRVNIGFVSGFANFGGGDVRARVQPEAIAATRVVAYCLIGRRVTTCLTAIFSLSELEAVTIGVVVVRSVRQRAVVMCDALIDRHRADRTGIRLRVQIPAVVDVVM